MALLETLLTKCLVLISQMFSPQDKDKERYLGLDFQLPLDPVLSDREVQGSYGTHKKRNSDF